MFRQGICCGCYEAKTCQPRKSKLSPEEKECFRLLIIGEQIHWIVLPHELRGELCEGSNQIPQVLIKNKGIQT